MPVDLVKDSTKGIADLKPFLRCCPPYTTLEVWLTRNVHLYNYTYNSEQSEVYMINSVESMLAALSVAGRAEGSSHMETAEQAKSRATYVFCTIRVSW